MNITIENKKEELKKDPVEYEEIKGKNSHVPVMLMPAKQVLPNIKSAGKMPSHI